jgi:hypothetical protein
MHERYPHPEKLSIQYFHWPTGGDAMYLMRPGANARIYEITLN